MWNSSWMADWLTTQSYVTPHYLIRSIYTNIFIILCNSSEILSHVSRTGQCNLAEATCDLHYITSLALFLCWLAFGRLNLPSEPTPPTCPPYLRWVFSFIFSCWGLSVQATHFRCTHSTSVMWGTHRCTVQWLHEGCRQGHSKITW